MNNLIINGDPVDPNDAATNANVAGFISALTQVDDTAVADAARYGRLHAEAVDGIHAGMEKEVMGLIGDESYRHAAGVYIAGSGESGSELLSQSFRRVYGIDVYPGCGQQYPVRNSARGRA